MEVFIKKIFFLVLLTFHSRGFPGIFDILSEEMKEHVAYLRMLPDEIQTIILQQWFTKGMLQTRQRVRTLSLSGNTNCSMNPNGTALASGSDDGTIRLWAGTLLTLSGHTDGVRSVKWNYDGTLLTSEGWDGTIKLWKPDGTLVHTLSGYRGSVESVAWSPDDTMLATASYDGRIKLWKPDGTLVQTLLGHADWVNSLAWNPDGTILASAGTTIKLWKSDGTLVQTLSGHTSQVNSLSWNPDGTLLAAGHSDRTIRFWNFSQPLLDPQEWNNLTLEQALLLRLLYASTRYALQMLLPEKSEYRKSDIHQALNVFSPATRQRLIDRYHLLQTLLTGNPMSNSL